jgi:hypothetical protein
MAIIGVKTEAFQAGMRNLSNVAKSEAANIAKGMIGAFGAQAIAGEIVRFQRDEATPSVTANRVILAYMNADLNAK